MCWMKRYEDENKVITIGFCHLLGEWIEVERKSESQVKGNCSRCPEESIWKPGKWWLGRKE